MWWLLVSATWGQTCAEVSAMVQAEVPFEAMRAELRRSGRVYSDMELACLRQSGVPESLVAVAEEGDSPEVEPMEPMHLEVRDAPRIVVAMDCGSVDVIGSSTQAVEVSGALQAGARVAVDREPDGLTLTVTEKAAVARTTPAIPRYPSGETEVAEGPQARKCGVLRIEAPRSASVVVRSVDASVRALWLRGRVDVRTRYGSIDVVGTPEEVVVNTTRGTVHIDATSAHIRAQSISGVVEVGAGAGARVSVKSVSGPVWVWGGPLRRLDATSVSGNLRLYAAVEEDAVLELETHRGRIEALVPPRRGLELIPNSGDDLPRPPGTAVRPGSFTARKVAPEAQLADFTDREDATIAARGIFVGERPSRWWFANGARIERRQFVPDDDFELRARSFSGEVKLAWVETFPVVTGDLLEVLDGASEALARCVGPASTVVAAFSASRNGRVSEVLVSGQTAGGAPLAPDAAPAVCVARVVEGLELPPSEHLEVVWPIVTP